MTAFIDDWTDNVYAVLFITEPSPWHVILFITEPSLWHVILFITEPTLWHIILFAGAFETAKDNRGDSEIAFVHSDGRIERFRPLICTNTSTRDVPPVRKQYNHRTEVRRNSHDAKYSNDKEDYAAFQPLCIKLDSVPALCLGTDLGDAISLAGCDVPPSYEEALDMPLAANINTSANTSRRDLGRESQSDYCNINVGQQNSKSNTQWDQTVANTGVQ